MYSIFSSLFGTINNMLTIGGGWTIIDHVKDIRKIIRKLNQNKAQVIRDIEVIIHMIVII